MPLLGLKGRLFIAVSCLVISSGFFICVIVTHWYGQSLRESMKLQATYLGTAIALEGADKVLIHDLVGLHKMLDHHTKSNPSVSYLFVERDGQVLAHTFPRGVPAQLLDWSYVSSGDSGSSRNIVSHDGKHYLEVIQPIFGGNAGRLHLGFSESIVEEQIRRLWIEISFITGVILASALAGSLFFLKRITRPLGDLAEAVGSLDESITGQKHPNIWRNDEVAALTSAFGAMSDRIKAYTARLEKQASELEKSHNQTKHFCEIVKEMGSLQGLRDMGTALIQRLRLIIPCSKVCLALMNDSLDCFYVVTDRTMQRITELSVIDGVSGFLATLRGVSVSTPPPVLSQYIPGVVEESGIYVAIPIHYDSQVIGSMVIVCSGSCTCSSEQRELAGLILAQVSGVLRRALIFEENAARFDVEREGATCFDGIYGKDPKMKVVFRLIEDAAPTEATVLILGESGTGKELVARSIHLRSGRRDRPFVVINCAAYPDTLLESELFGHEKGAFTGALRQRMGRFEQADGGTVFLDEVGEISAQAQVKLLRVIQTQTFERLGGQKSLRVDIRVIAATNKDLEKLIQEGRFREDLFYRLNVIPIEIPPLKDRRNDVPLLARYFLELFAREQDKDVKSISHDAMRRMLEYHWPGNVRELENSIEHAVVVCKGAEIEARDLPSTLLRTFHEVQEKERAFTIYDSEKFLLEQTLMECSWNKKEAARRLGIGRTTLYAKIRRYQLQKPTIQ